MKHLSVQKPCSENWEKMTPTQKGAFCQKCCKQVIDFSNKSDQEIKSILLANSGKEVCGRITNNQLTHLNQEFEAWRHSNTWSMQRASFYAFLFVFGLSMVSCSNQEDERRIEQIQQTAHKQLINIDKEEVVIEKVEEVVPDVIEPELVLDDEFIEEEPEVLIREMEVQLDSVRIVHDNMRYVTMGMMVSSRHYVDYLEEVTPVKEEIDDNLPDEFATIAFPNPTQGRTTIKFEVPTTTHASFELYSMQGMRIRSMGAADYEPGIHEVPFDMSTQQPGTYIITILSKDFKESVKVIKM